MQTIASKYFMARNRLFTWRCEACVMYKIILAFSMALATGLLAQVKMYLPWTPIPITGQVFAVLLAGVILGGRWGGISQTVYIILGIIGVPWFAGGIAGYACIVGPTGGYLLGFVLAALFLGYFTDKHLKSRKLFSLIGLMVFANFILIHGLGLLQLGLWMHFVNGTMSTLWGLLSIGTVPFIIGDLSKIIVAALIANLIIPKEVESNEKRAMKNK